MKSRKVERAYEMVKIGMAMAEITRALKMTNADWKEFIEEFSVDFISTFSGVRDYIHAKMKKDELKRKQAEALKPADFIKLTDRGMILLKQTIVNKNPHMANACSYCDFDEIAEVEPYGVRGNNGMAYFTVSGKEEGGFTGDLTVSVRFPNSYIYILGNGDIVDTVPASVALAAARVKMTGAIDNLAHTKCIDIMLRDMKVDEIVIGVDTPTSFTSTHRAIIAANQYLGLYLNPAHFIDEQVNSSFVTIRPRPDAPVEGVFSIRTRVEK